MESIKDKYQDIGLGSPEASSTKYEEYGSSSGANLL